MLGTGTVAGYLGAMTDQPRVGPHQVIPFRAERNATVDTLRWAKKRLHVPVLLEVDVTAARAAIRARRRETGEGLSFTAWVVSCVARAAAEHPRVHAVRRGKRKIVLFDEVDISVLVERPVGDPADGETLPMPVVLRDVASKTAGEIHTWIRRARATNVEEGTSSIESPAPGWLQSLFFRLPAPLRDLLVWRPLLRNPARVKKTMGTVAVTATGMAAPGVLGWGIPRSIHPLAIGVGGIAKRDSADGTRDILALTVVFDHAVTDGAPVGRFIRTVVGMMEQAGGL